MRTPWLPLLILIFLALQILILRHAQAEYRVYRLGVKYEPQQKKEIEVLTTLDDLQYVTYYKMTPAQTTRLIDHWMCRGRTNDFKKYCSKPKTPALRLPATAPGAATNQSKVRFQTTHGLTTRNQNPQIVIQ